ncbi:class I SAM-dependent methyltransferase [Halorussus litoreus]|uniref:class I SAM-dependent methyltransferase n=1 Tax=Halorussus litoreus TaxID=1710536 RepID=UPI000E263A27|nr:class I SAM-dependent methyltransferase [Halorussus litoreus]
MNSDDVLQQWADRSGAYSPDYYAYYGPNETSELLRERLDAVVGTDAAVLELGCSSGRHLAHLREHGYDDLHGVDVNGDAFDVMADAYPDLHDAGTFYEATIEDAVREFDDGRFDAVYSVETLQHVHPDHEWAFDEIARVTDDLLVTVENEGGPNGEADAAGDGKEIDRREDLDGSANPGDPEVNYVNDEFPLYYRNWKQVFTPRGFEQVHARTTDRDVFRAFRPDGKAEHERSRNDGSSPSE